MLCHQSQLRGLGGLNRHFSKELVTRGGSWQQVILRGSCVPRVGRVLGWCEIRNRITTGVQAEQEGLNMIKFKLSTLLARALTLLTMVRKNESTQESTATS